MEQLTPEELKEKEQETGRDIQTSLYSWFLQKAQKGKLTVEVQAVQKTNRLLAKQGIAIGDYALQSPQELAKILGVDAVIMGNFSSSQPISAGASAALGVLTGDFGTTNAATINLFIYNGADGKTLVNYTDDVSGSLGSSTSSLIESLMRGASKRIPYVKK